MIVTRVAGGLTLPVGKIVAVGLNYQAHAREMGAGVPGEPVLFFKPPTALLQGGGQVRLPSWSRQVHHEVEMVVRVGMRPSGGPAGTCVLDGFGVGLDLTARDVQRKAKKTGGPWAVAKGFDGSAPLSGLLPLEGDGVRQGPGDRLLVLDVNGVRRQESRLSRMVHGVPALLGFIPSRFTLEPGDLIFTGSPAGVGPLAPGDHVEARLEPGPSLVLDVLPADVGAEGGTGA